MKYSWSVVAAVVVAVLVLCLAACGPAPSDNQSGGDGPVETVPPSS